MIVGIGFPTKTKGTAQGLFRGSVHEAFHEAFELEMERGAGRGEGHAHRAAGVQGGTEGGAGTPAHKGRHRSQGRGEASERRRGQPASPTEKNSDRREFVEKLVEMEVAVSALSEETKDELPTEVVLAAIGGAVGVLIAAAAACKLVKMRRVAEGKTAAASGKFARGLRADDSGMAVGKTPTTDMAVV